MSQGEPKYVSWVNFVWAIGILTAILFVLISNVFSSMANNLSKIDSLTDKVNDNDTQVAVVKAKLENIILGQQELKALLIDHEKATAFIK